MNQSFRTLSTPFLSSRFRCVTLLVMGLILTLGACERAPQSPSEPTPRPTAPPEPPPEPTPPEPLLVPAPSGPEPGTVAPKPEPAPPEPPPQPAPLDQGRVLESSILLKVVGLSDNISIFEVPGSPNVLSKMETLRPYFVVEDAGKSYQISPRQEEGGVEGFVLKEEVATWNTREGLHFRGDTFRQDRRGTVAAWESEAAIREYAKNWNERSSGPAFKEEAQTIVGSHGIIPYPLLDTKEVETRDGKTRRIHQVLIPAIVAGKVETPLTAEEVEEVAGAVTFCVVFDATASMGRYAKDFAATIDKMLSELDLDTNLAAAGFVLFRDLKDGHARFEIAHPMPLNDATDWLRRRTRGMVGGDDPAEPVLDAMMLAQNSFLWNGGTAIRGARRIAIVVANRDAKPETVALTSNVPKGLSVKDVSARLLESNIAVFALQAGSEDHGNLINVLSALATATGGEFYRAAVDSEQISKEFSKSLEKLVSQRMDEGTAAARRLKPHISPRVGGGTVIALNVIDSEMKDRLEDAAPELHISSGGVVITKAWVFDEPNLYREEILIEKEVLEWLVRFFNVLTDSTLDATSLLESTANLIEALIGEDLRENVELQELLEKRLGIHFTTNLLSFELELLATLSPAERNLLQQNIRNATGALAEFLEMNTKRFNRESRLWMPVSYLP